MSSALLLAPDFLLIVIGALLFRFARFGDGLWSGLEQLVYFVLFPALLFQSTASANFHGAGTWLFMAAGFAATLGGAALGWLALPVLRPSYLDFASSVQAGFRFNSYIALAAASRLGGAEGAGLMAILLGTNVPLANALAVHALARGGQTRVLLAMARNPLIIATLAGLIVNYAGVVFPDFIATTLGRLGSASIALGLMTVGAGLRLSASGQARALKAWILMLKLMVLPAFTLLLAQLLHLTPLQRLIVVTFAALPSASSAYILAVRMGGNGPLVAYLVSAGTALSALTLSMWVAITR